MVSEKLAEENRRLNIKMAEEMMEEDRRFREIKRLEWWIDFYTERIDEQGVTDDWEEATFSNHVDDPDGPIYIWDDYVLDLNDKIEELDELVGLEDSKY